MHLGEDAGYIGDILCGASPVKRTMNTKTLAMV